MNYITPAKFYELLEQSSHYVVKLHCTGCNEVCRFTHITKEIDGLSAHRVPRPDKRFNKTCSVSLDKLYEPDTYNLYALLCSSDSWAESQRNIHNHREELTVIKIKEYNNGIR